MDLTTFFQMFSDLFLKYTFGDIWLGGIFTMFIMIYIGWRMRLSPDGWVVIMAGIGMLFGTFYFSSIGITVFILIGLGFLAYFFLRRVIRSY